jgi:hypothetical protein
MTADEITETRELDSRSADGFHVRLLWNAHDRHVFVAVMPRGGWSFVLQVRPDERALDVYHHPYAYAAAHGVVTDWDGPLSVEHGCATA